VSLEAVAILVASLWIAILTLISVLLVRQVGLLTVRLDRERDSGRVATDGLKLGTVAPEPLRAVVEGLESPSFLLVLGANCLPCRDLVAGLDDGVSFDSPLVALVTGNEEIAAHLGRELPDGTIVVVGNTAQQIFDVLNLDTTPFIFELADRISGKTALRSAAHLISFIEGKGEPGNRLPAPSLEVMHNGAGAGTARPSI
jgi:hypothetical protein